MSKNSLKRKTVSLKLWILVGLICIITAVWAVDLIRYDVRYTSDHEIAFRDSGLKIYSSADGVLDLVSDGTLQLTAGSILVDSTVADIDSFTTTAEYDTVVISGALSTDMYFLTANDSAAVDQQDVLQAIAKDDTLIVRRLAAGASALNYAYLRIRPTGN